MERYEKTELNWSWTSLSELQTDIPVTDWPHPEDKPRVHTIASIQTQALPDRGGQMIIDFRRVAISPNTDARVIICDRLESALTQHRIKSAAIRYFNLKSGRGYLDKFVIEFALNDGHHFCESVIPAVEAILDAFQIEDPHKFRLSEFDLVRRTMIKFEDGWITYANWLRIRNRLPVTHA